MLGEAFVALVAYSGVDIVPGLAGADERGVLHGRRGAAQHCGQRTLRLGTRPAQRRDQCIVPRVRMSLPLPSSNLIGLEALVSFSPTHQKLHRGRNLLPTAQS